MFISALSERLDRVDPYWIQRLALYKALFLATLMVYVYWLFLPVNFSAFVGAIIMVAIYESPILVSYREKDKTLLFIISVILFCSSSFYLVYLYHYLFLLYFLSVVTVVYFLIARYFPKIKNLSMLMIAVSAINLTQEPQGISQIAIDIFSANLLCFSSLIVGLKLFPNYYFYIWKRAQSLYIQCSSRDITLMLAQAGRTSLLAEVAHIDIMLAYQRLLPPKMIAPGYRLYVSMRNLHFALNTSLHEGGYEEFWLSIRDVLDKLARAMNDRIFLINYQLTVQSETNLQTNALKNLKQGIASWNKLCELSMR